MSLYSGRFILDLDLDSIPSTQGRERKTAPKTETSKRILKRGLTMAIEERYGVALPAPLPLESPVDITLLHYDFGRSDKFWECYVWGPYVVVYYGRAGTKGQTHVTAASSDAGAIRIASRKVQEKTNKGYYAVSARESKRLERVPE